MWLPAGAAQRWLPALQPNNAQGELYLTDCVAMARAEGMTVARVCLEHAWHGEGVNDRVQLADMERRVQMQTAIALMRSGVSLADPARLDVRGLLQCEPDVNIDVGCVFEGEVRLATGVQIGAHCVIRNATIAANTVIAPFSHIDGAQIGVGAKIGPYARLRPGAEIADAAHIGNFVEIKNSIIGVGSKANHLAYVGDATVGAGVNIGAGVITCNYDGVNKHRTVIGDGAFIGSDVQLVAPVTVGENATIGAGTTLTKDAPAGQLTVSRAKQVSIAGWTRPVKIKKT